MIITGGSFSAACFIMAANASAAAFDSSLSRSAPAIILSGCLLSYRALFSRRNSGQKMTRPPASFPTPAVKPAGTVDLTTIRASFAQALASSTAFLAADVSKLSFSSSKFVGTAMITMSALLHASSMSMVALMPLSPDAKKASIPGSFTGETPSFISRTFSSSISQSTTSCSPARRHAKDRPTYPPPMIAILTCPDVHIVFSVIALT